MAKGNAWWIVAIAVALLAFVGYGLFAPSPSDEEQIKAALAESLKAGKEGRPGSVLELLSRNFKVNEEQVVGRRDIGQYIRDYKPNIEIRNQTPTVSGDSAEIVSPAKVSISVPPVSIDIRQVTLGFKKEHTTRMLIFPAKDWKLESVTVPEEVVGEVMATAGN